MNMISGSLARSCAANQLVVWTTSHDWPIFTFRSVVVDTVSESGSETVDHSTPDIDIRSARGPFAVTNALLLFHRQGRCDGFVRHHLDQYLYRLPLCSDALSSHSKFSIEPLFQRRSLLKARNVIETYQDGSHTDRDECQTASTLACDTVTDGNWISSLKTRR